ncbi:MAG: tetratricopeptide repeat protein, partial [Bdellovibrionales bacterium]|nr:tetratricopeptide repeat protein [Oligoflexia bacterium]
MAGSFSKSSKSLVNSKKWIIQLGLFLAIAGCASQPPEKKFESSDAPYNIAQNLQRNWEGNPAISSADYHFALAQAYSNEGKVDRAIEEYRAAMAYDQESAILHAKLAAEYLKKGSMSYAVDECKASLKIDPSSVDVHLMLGGIYSLNNETDRSLAEYESVLKMDPKNDEAAVFKTQVLAEKDRIDEALKFIRGFTAKVNDSAAAWYYTGKLEQTKEHTNEAISAYRKALAIRSGFSQASLALGLIFELNKENAKAVQIYEAQLEEKQDIQIAGRL